MVQWNRNEDGSLEAADPAGGVYRIEQGNAALSVMRYTGYGSLTETLWSGTILAKAMLFVYDEIRLSSTTMRRAA